MMPDLTDLLDDEDSQSSDKPDEKTNAAFAEMRKTNKQLQKEIEELRAFKAEQDAAMKTAARKKAAEAAGVPWAQIEFAKALDSLDEPSAEAVQALKVQYGLAEQDPDAPALSPTTSETGFTPTVITESSQLGSKVYTDEEFVALMRSDPKKAEQAYKAGRLKTEEPDWSFTSRLYGRDT